MKKLLYLLQNIHYPQPDACYPRRWLCGTVLPVWPQTAAGGLPVADRLCEVPSYCWERLIVTARGWQGGPDSGTRSGRHLHPRTWLENRHKMWEAWGGRGEIVAIESGLCLLLYDQTCPAPCSNLKKNVLHNKYHVRALNITLQSIMSIINIQFPQGVETWSLFCLLEFMAHKYI